VAGVIRLRPGVGGQVDSGYSQEAVTFFRGSFPVLHLPEKGMEVLATQPNNQPLVPNRN
jgi:hypothetical protein